VRAAQAAAAPAVFTVKFSVQQDVMHMVQALCRPGSGARCTAAVAGNAAAVYLPCVAVVVAWAAGLKVRLADLATESVWCLGGSSCWRSTLTDMTGQFGI